MCGGTYYKKSKCLKLENGAWMEHSTFNHERLWESTIPTKPALFIFGGYDSTHTYEYLPKGSTTWLMGKTEIPYGFMYGSAIATRSGQEILLIGGSYTERRILSFNVNDHTFRVLPSKLNVGRNRHKCAFIPNTNKIMITGGLGLGNWNGSDSTEILDIEDGSVTMASPMNFKRLAHGMGTLTINGEDRLAVFGGFDWRKRLDNVELYNTQTGKWEMSDIKLKSEKSAFGFLTLKIGYIMPKQ